MNRNIQGDFQICISAPLRKGILKICSKFTGEHPCRSVISMNLLCSDSDYQTSMMSRFLRKYAYNFYKKPIYKKIEAGAP